GPPMVFIIFLSAVTVLLPVMFTQRRQWPGHFHHLALIALFGGLANLLFQNALFYGDVVRVMILFYLLPIWSVLGGRIFLGEKIDLMRGLTLAAAISGGVLILGGPEIFRAPPSWLDLMAIGSGFAFAMNNIVFRASQTLPLGSKVSAMFFGVVVMMGAYLLFTPAVTWPSDMTVILLAAAYGIIGLMLITFGTQWGVTHLEAGRASIIIVMELVVAVISSVIILSQSLTMIEISGALLVSTAAILEGFREEAAEAETRTPA
ncbi:MAG: DMT family transporter, partial [Gammaproteobacteria bacterium]|nr:DMT family transporter [Gammaproteobacteria bacterium]